MNEALLIRYIVGDVNAEESASVEAWINASQENKGQFEALEKTWKHAENPFEVEPAQVDVDAAWRSVKGRMQDLSDIEQKQMPTTRSLWFYASRVAAVLVMGLLIYAIYQFQSSIPETMTLSSADSTITDNPLPDGTIISLNNDSEVVFPEDFEENERRVAMKGEVYFDVEPEPERPFIIEANEAVITVLGTAFNVKALEDDNAVEVLVEEGLVELSNAERTQTAQLAVGEKGIYLRETKEVKKETEIDVESLFWLNKTLLFRDTRLSMVFTTLEKLYKVEINVENEDILDCELTAKFSNEKIEDIIEHISVIFELETEQDADTFLIRGNGCP